jgi:hypothetical protein
LAINQTLARIKIDVPEASDMIGGVNQGRRAANIGWRGRRLMPRRLSTTSGVRQRVIETMQASWDRWRIEGGMCELERALNAGESGVLSGSELARAGLPYGGWGRARGRLYLLDEFDQIHEYFGDV